MALEINSDTIAEAVVSHLKDSAVLAPRLLTPNQVAAYLGLTRWHRSYEAEQRANQGIILRPGWRPWSLARWIASWVITPNIPTRIQPGPPLVARVPHFPKLNEHEPRKGFWSRSCIRSRCWTTRKSSGSCLWSPVTLGFEKGHCFASMDSGWS